MTKKKAHRIWIRVKEGRYTKQQGHSLTSWVSLDGFAMASHSCCTLFECVWFLLSENHEETLVTCMPTSEGTNAASAFEPSVCHREGEVGGVYQPGELCAHRAAEPERALCSLPGLSCLVCRWSMRKGIGWSGVSVINLVINSYRSKVKQRAVRWK